MKLSLIIVTYNSCKYIKRCLDSALESILPFDEYEIIIVDNHSTDKTFDIINHFRNSKIKIIKENSNTGYSKAVNKAVERANFSNILILNPDTIVMKNTIPELFQLLSRNGIGVTGAKLLNSDGTFQVSSRRHFPTLIILFPRVLRLNHIFKKNNFFGKYNYTYLNNDKEALVDSVSGACMMFSKDIFNAVNGFDERFFLYFEDTDFCLKVKSLGFKIAYCPKAEAVHYNDYSDNYTLKSLNFYKSFEVFIFKYRHKICLGVLVYYFAKLINNIFQLKRFLVFKK